MPFKVKFKSNRKAELKKKAIEVWSEFGKPLGLKPTHWTKFSYAFFVDRKGEWVNVELKVLVNMREVVTEQVFVFPKYQDVED